MMTITRRALLKAAPGAALLGAGAAKAALPLDNETSRLIEAHRAAMAASVAAARSSDCVALGREATAKEWAAFVEAADSFDAAEIALCEHAPMTLAESRAKAAYIAADAALGGFDGPGRLDAFLRSISQMVRA